MPQLITLEPDGKRYPAETAGRLMITDVPLTHATSTIGQVAAQLSAHAKKLESINYIYVIDGHRHLVGVISIKDVFRQAKSSLVSKHMLTEPAVTHPHTDQERVAIQAVEYNLKALPVVDQNHRLLGVVPSDAILSVLHAEGIEDMLRTVGIQSSGKEIMSASVASAFKQRIPWLIVGLFGGLAAASLISGFEGALREQLLLAAFIPAVVYIADAVGGQSQTVFVRLLLLQPNIALGGYLWRELRLGSMLAVSLAGLLAALSWFFHGEWVLSSILFLSIGITVMLAATIGVILPWLFSRFKLDPAVASGPFATVLRDLTSLAIYFSIALLLLERV